MSDEKADPAILAACGLRSVGAHRRHCPHRHEVATPIRHLITDEGVPPRRTFNRLGVLSALPSAFSSHGLAKNPAQPKPKLTRAETIIWGQHQGTGGQLTTLRLVFMTKVIRKFNGYKTVPGLLQ